MLTRVLISVVLCGAAAPVLPQTESDLIYKRKMGRWPPRIEFARELSDEAWLKRSEKLFRSMDSDKDGVASIYEWRRVHQEATRRFPCRGEGEQPAHCSIRFSDLDRDGDRKLTLAEWRQQDGEAAIVTGN